MDAMGGTNAASTDGFGNRLPGCGHHVGAGLGAQDVDFNKEGRTTMKRFTVCIVTVVLMGVGVSGQQAQAADDLEFATPVVTEASPACDIGGCFATRFAHSRIAHHRGRRPIARWFQERRPVRRVLRGVARLVVHRCGR